MIHELKIWPEFFEAVLAGEKTFEIRKDDRGFRVGDGLTLREWQPRTKEYTNRTYDARVTYILAGPGFGIMQDYVIMGIRAAGLSAER